MATNSSDFVLDDDLDQDDEVLSYQQNHHQRPDDDETDIADVDSTKDQSEVYPKATFVKDASISTPMKPTAEALGHAPLPQTDSKESNRTVDHPPFDERLNTPPISAVIIDGFPLSARRPDLDAFLGASASAVTNVRLRRLEQHGLLRVRIQFSDFEAAGVALQRDGAEWRDRSISVKPASDERWMATLPGQESRSVQQSSLPSGSVSTPSSSSGSGIGLPSMSSVSHSFWSAFGAARSVAERLEESARQLGQRLEHELHVSEKVEQSRARMRDADRTYGVTAKVSEVAAAGRDTAQSVDRKLGISDGVGSVVDGVTNAARKVAREVDENLRVSDKARDAANAAISSPTVGPVARKVASSFDSKTPPSKHNHKPRRLNMDDPIEDSNSPSSEAPINASNPGQSYAPSVSTAPVDSSKNDSTDIREPDSQ